VTADVVVRRIRPDDASLLRDVRLRALATDPPSFGSTHEREAAYPDERWREWCEGDAAGGEMTTLLALRGGEAVGLVAACRDDEEPHVFGVFSMWVAPEVRGEGIGRRLLHEVEDWISSSGGTAVRLSVTNTASAAQQLYETAGYERDGRSNESRHTRGLVEIGLRKQLAR
jgi:ribosomal protein S18 acetylase RimI-like enzyme